MIDLPEQDSDDFWQAQASLPTGSICTLIEFTNPRRKVKKRPIGFTADIDQEYEE